MSLTLEQKQRTSQELRANYELCPLGGEALCAALGWSPQHLRSTLDIDARSNPGDVWLLRDFLEQVIRDKGGEPQPFSVLTPGMRAQSEIWFGRRQVPPTPK